MKRLLLPVLFTFCTLGVNAQSALDKVRMIEEMGYDNLVVSIKSSDVMMCVKAQ